MEPRLYRRIVTICLFAPSGRYTLLVFTAREHEYHVYGPCWQLVIINSGPFRLPVFTGVQNDTRVHGPC